MKIIVGSKNPVKLEAVKEAFEKIYNEVEVDAVETPSGVSDQPIGEETYDGAYNRALALIEQEYEADYYVGIEGGIHELYGKWFAFGGVCIISNGKVSYGSSAQFELPGEIVKELLQGEELGLVIDKKTGQVNSKQKDGAVGFLSGGVMTRKELYVSGIITAMLPHLNDKLYFGENHDN